MNPKVVSARFRHIEDLAVQLDVAIRKLRADLDASVEAMVDSDGE